MTQPGASTESTIVAADIRWSFPLPVALASRLRELLEGICSELLGHDETESVAMAAHELFENVVKYSAEGPSSFEAEIYRRDGQAYIRLRTRNPATPERARDLRRLVEMLGKAPDPLAVYDELIATSKLRRESGLGLGRVRAEAQMAIACSEEGPTVTLVAERPVSVRAP